LKNLVIFVYKQYDVYRLGRMCT